MSFIDIARPMIARGIPVIPLKPRTKDAFQKDWPDRASTEQKQVEEWGRQYPDANAGSVAKAIANGFWFLELDKPEAGDRIESETGKRVPDTFRVRSRPGRGHLYWKQSPASLAMGNISQAHVIGKDWSARVDNQYVVAPGSIHPVSGVAYERLNDNEIVEAPDWLIEFLISQKAKAKETEPKVDNGLIEVGARNATLASRLGKIHHDAGGLTKETLLVVARDISDHHFEAPLPDTELENTAGSISKYSVVVDEFKERQELKALELKQVRELQWSRETLTPEAAYPEMPTTALASTRLQDIYSAIFQPHGWTLDFAVPALVTAASVLVPRFVAPEENVIQGDDNMVNLYTALIGEVHCGKSQAMEWAAKAMGIYKKDVGPHYFDVNAGSAEQLIDGLWKRQNNPIHNSVLIIQDEYSHLFSKALIPNASFGSFLTKTFYRKHQIYTRPRGKEAVLNLSMSMIGGIVEDDFDSVFNASSLGGCYDRFLFGYAPRTWKWSYRPYPLPVMDTPAPTFGDFGWTPVPVTLDGSVFEVAKDWNRKDQNLGRIVEICTRIATIYASMDGRELVTGKDLEDLWDLAQYQLDLRKQFQPNAGINPDAQFANAAVRWIEKYAQDWTPVWELKKGVHSHEMKLGPNVAERALYALARGGRIQLWMNTGDLAKNPLPLDYAGVVPRVGLVRRTT